MNISFGPTRRDFLRTLGLGAGALAFSPFAHGQKALPNELPNFVIMIGDDIGWNDLGCYGNQGVKTPNIDRMAKEGIRFNNAWLTASSCSPSRCSIISGRYPHNTGAAELHTPLPEGQVPFPALLQKAGYYTAQAGKWHFGPTNKGPASEAFDRKANKQEPPGAGGENNWVSVIENRPKDKPFFMWLAAFDAHRDWSLDAIAEPHKPEDVVVPPFLADTPETRQDLAAYYNEISRMDHYVGLVAKTLERQGVAEKTMIIVMSDNGRPFPRCKTRVYASGMKTPFLVKWPKAQAKPGSVCDSLISSIDIAPTVLEMAGLSAPPCFQGVSFAPLLNHVNRKTRQYVFAEHNWHDYEALERMACDGEFLYVCNARPQLANEGPADSVRSPSHKALQNVRDKGNLTQAQRDVFLAPRPAEELFEMGSDPFQIHNIADDVHQEKLIYLRGVMDKWRRETKDTTPDHLTPDEHDRETGKELPNGLKRGTMPGAGAGAESVEAKGPY